MIKYQRPSTELLTKRQTQQQLLRLHNTEQSSGRVTKLVHKQDNYKPVNTYRVIQNDFWGFNNLSYTIHLVLQMQPHVISFYGVTSRIRFMFLLFPQVSRNWRLLHATHSLERTRLSSWCL